MILKKQTHLTGVWTAELDFDPSTENEEAGTAVFWSCFAYASVLVRKHAGEGKRSVVLRWTDPDCDEYKASRLLDKRWLADDARSLNFKRLSPPPAQLRYEFMYNQHRIPFRIRLARMTTLFNYRHCRQPYWSGLDHLILRTRAHILVSSPRERRDSYAPTLHTSTMYRLSTRLDRVQSQRSDLVPFGSSPRCFMHV